MRLSWIASGFERGPPRLLSAAAAMPGQLESDYRMGVIVDA